jgi:hypothetical protein
MLAFALNRKYRGCYASGSRVTNAVRSPGRVLIMRKQRGVATQFHDILETTFGYSLNAAVGEDVFRGASLAAAD